MFEKKKYEYINKNRGADKVALFNVANQAWTNSKFLS
jgi:hypothetical protein